MNKNIVLAGFAATIVTASLTSSLVAGAATTSPTITSSTAHCGEVDVALKGFSALPQSSSVTATLDGTTVVNHRFASTYSFVFYVDNASTHTVRVRATNRNGHHIVKTITTRVCTFA